MPVSNILGHEAQLTKKYTSTLVCQHSIFLDTVNVLVDPALALEFAWVVKFVDLRIKDGLDRELSSKYLQSKSLPHSWAII